MPTNNPYNPQLHPESQPGAAQQQFPTPPTPPMPMMPPGVSQPQWQDMPINRGGIHGRGKEVFPSWLMRNALVVYIFALAIVTIIYSSYSLPWYYMLSGVVSVLVFFGYGYKLANSTSDTKLRSDKRFERRIFWVAFVPRVAFMLLMYTIFQRTYGDAFGFENGDARYYDDMGQFVARLIREGNFHFRSEITQWNGGHDDIADMGYGIYVGLIYWLTGSGDVLSNSSVFGAGAVTNPISILAVRLIKCVLSSLTVLLLYKLAKRNFEENTARVAAIFCALWPNFWYYCSAHLKETEMVFLAVLFVEQADQMLRSRQFTAWKVIPVLLIAAAMFTVRTPLGLVALLALIFSVVMSSSRVVTWGKRIIVGILAVALIGVTAGNQLEEQARGLFQTVQSNQQQGNMEWRARREHGNAFAKYAGKTVFAPLIFTIPFPSMVRPFEGQDVQQLLNGGNFVKNIISFYTILAMIMLLMSGKWREHLLPLSFMLGYLVVLTVSTFAQSERFHQPAMPFELMFAAYGLSIAVTKKKYKRWFTYWCILMFVACIAWNWFKMAGRGL